MVKTVAIYITNLFLYLVLAFGVNAATLNFNPTTSAPKVDETISVAITIDSGAVQITGTDIYITYDKTKLSVQSITKGDFFPLVNNIPTEGRIYIYGVVANGGEFKTGTGTVATVIFKALTQSTTELVFDCDITKSETSKIVQNDTNVTNVINCSANGKHTVTIAGGGPITTPAAGVTGGTGGTLPESGVYDNAVAYSGIGVILLLAGIAMKLLLHV
ncbi:MAG: cohesin domain-containing protein [bacterium]|nr:cohesin domain-containing protein [bacterium]